MSDRGGRLERTRRDRGMEGRIPFVRHIGEHARQYAAAPLYNVFIAALINVLPLVRLPVHPVL